MASNKIVVSDFDFDNVKKVLLEIAPEKGDTEADSKILYSKDKSQTVFWCWPVT